MSIRHRLFLFNLLSGVLIDSIQAIKFTKDYQGDLGYHQKRSLLEEVLGEALTSDLEIVHSSQSIPMNEVPKENINNDQKEITSDPRLSIDMSETDTNEKSKELERDQDLLHFSCVPLIGFEPNDKDKSGLEPNEVSRIQHHNLRRRSTLNEWRKRLKAKISKNGCITKTKKIDLIKSTFIKNKWRALNLYLLNLVFRFSVWLEISLAKPVRKLIKKD
ncbi:hypothetical protein CROQUDRAFT_209182 [Cronartium quercuum f. sp. fusiforme G11]|uniref:Protein TIC 214 n=1 Tax=Cronartium quercuum f. sp. fusiforme G11 TaxID=708437 RepID=A0A9P6T9S3_9BASI|nr:hypothetical protein CROQUDRAFT_209182 [Cronartium quercuum f. sp. fusiforme G11]